MGKLTQDMARLRSEINSLKGSRDALMTELAAEKKNMKRTVSGMRADFRNSHKKMAAQQKADHKKFMTVLSNDVTGMLNGFREEHTAMAIKTKKENSDFVSDVALRVSGMLTGFQSVRADMAKESKAERTRFISDLATTVGNLRQETATDLAGARRAWQGVPAPKPAMDAQRRAAEQAEIKARAEAEMRAKEAEKKAKAEAEMKAKKEQREHPKVGGDPKPD